ncbi:XdhC family protein [Kiloniella laminariae]|uniref:XdhC family protein n=1 Tax=Kiloniella laminariae TaxID=454162 RepID=A0ABT4LJY7_9PROT|nr:XdhC family protein [Kiloniella laminariae]MCZ4281423.1 XdhC family protein [Kiloniella laminariae]
MKRSTLDQLVRSQQDKQTMVLLTDMKTGCQEIFYPLDPQAAHPLLDQILVAVREDLSFIHEAPGIHEEPGEQTFIQVYNPPLRLIIVGAVHISQFLVPMARMAGYDVTVIDPRRAFGNAVRFPDCSILNDWPDDALAELKPDHRTAVVILTHDPKLDDPALEIALPSPAFYIGALGSRRTHAKRLERLKHLPGLDRIDGPVGLDIGAKSPAEIALSILGAITAALRQGDEK